MGKPLEVVDRLLDSLNRHDVDAFIACFETTTRATNPIVRARPFKAATRYEKTAPHLESILDVRGEVIRFAESGDTVWIGLSVRGTRPDGFGGCHRLVYVSVSTMGECSVT